MRGVGGVAAESETRDSSLSRPPSTPSNPSYPLLPAPTTVKKSTNSLFPALNCLMNRHFGALFSSPGRYWPKSLPPCSLRVHSNPKSRRTCGSISRILGHQSLS